LTSKLSLNPSSIFILYMPNESTEPGDEDLLDLTAIQSLINGRTVLAILPEEVSDMALLAAVLRY